MSRDMASIKGTDAVLEIGKELLLASDLLRDWCISSRELDKHIVDMYQCQRIKYAVNNPWTIQADEMQGA